MKTNMKIDVEKSVIYRFDDRMDLSEAVLMLGEKGYFSDNEDFSNYVTGILARVICWFDQAEFTFSCRDEETSEVYRYFIPENKVVFNKEKKKKLRPFKSTKEFFATTGFNIGEVVHIKKFTKYIYEETSILNGVRAYIDEEFPRVDVIFGSCSRSFDELFKHFMYYKNGKWLRFGVKE